jgi:hypothetical protein
MKSLGTILPTKKSLKNEDDYALHLAKEKVKVASKKLFGCKAKRLGNEVRYYKTPSLYAVVSSTFKILWFEVRSDGDYSVNPSTVDK